MEGLGRGEGEETRWRRLADIEWERQLGQHRNITLFPGWAARRYRTSMPGDEGVPKLLINSPVNSFWPPASPLPFEVEVFTSGYAITRIVTLQAGLNEPSFVS